MGSVDTMRRVNIRWRRVGEEMFRSIKVLFCSGEDREKVARLVEECGADGYILKGEVLGKWVVENLG